jgi:hypothetical protein
MAKILKYWLPVVIWAIVIFGFSSRTVPSTSEIFWKDFIMKKTAHIIEYAIMAMLLYRALLGSGKAKREALIFSFLIAIAYAASDEFHQSFVSGREGRIRDVIIDAAGGGGALYLIKSHL